MNAIWAITRFGYPARDLTVIGVTGTDGKTTTAHLIFEILRRAGIRAALISTVGAFVDGKTIDTGFHVTTPDPLKIQALLACFKKKGVTHVILEATSHGLDQHRLLGCNFKAGVLTNITHEHLDYHQTFERYRAAKAKLFRGVDLAVINHDDPSFSLISSRVKKGAKIISYGIRSKSDLLAKKISFQPQGLEFEIKDGRENIIVETRLIGEYNVLNSLAAAGVARGLGIPWEDIKGALREFKGVPGRMEIIAEGQDFNIIVDFAHTPGAYEELFKALTKTWPARGGKLIAVFGAPGERDKDKRPMMGKVAAAFCDFIVLTTDDPRHENPERIIDEITRGIRQTAKVWDGNLAWRKRGKWVIRILDRGEAIAFAIRLAKKGDIVALLGQGHQKAMPVGDTEVPWTDQEAARVALKGGIRKLYGYT